MYLYTAATQDKQWYEFILDIEDKAVKEKILSLVWDFLILLIWTMEIRAKRVQSDCHHLIFYLYLVSCIFYLGSYIFNLVSCNKNPIFSALEQSSVATNYLKMMSIQRQNFCLWHFVWLVTVRHQLSYVSNMTYPYRATGFARHLLRHQILFISNIHLSCYVLFETLFRNQPSSVTAMGEVLLMRNPTLGNAGCNHTNGTYEWH